MFKKSIEFYPAPAIEQKFHIQSSPSYCRCCQFMTTDVTFRWRKKVATPKSLLLAALPSQMTAATLKTSTKSTSFSLHNEPSIPGSLLHFCLNTQAHFSRCAAMTLESTCRMPYQAVCMPVVRAERTLINRSFAAQISTVQRFESSVSYPSAGVQNGFPRIHHFCSSQCVGERPHTAQRSSTLPFFVHWIDSLPK